MDCLYRSLCWKLPALFSGLIIKGIGTTVFRANNYIGGLRINIDLPNDALGIIPTGLFCLLPLNGPAILFVEWKCLAIFIDGLAILSKRIDFAISRSNNDTSVCIFSLSQEIASYSGSYPGIRFQHAYPSAIPFFR